MHFRNIHRKAMAKIQQCLWYAYEQYQEIIVDLYSSGTLKQRIKPLKRLLSTCRDMWGIHVSYENGKYATVCFFWPTIVNTSCCHVGTF